MPYADGYMAGVIGLTTRDAGCNENGSLPSRVLSIACGGAHTLVLCSSDDDLAEDSRRSSPRTRSCHGAAGTSGTPVAVASQSILETRANATSRDGLNAIGNASGHRLRAIAGRPLTVQLVARDASGIDCRLADGQRFVVEMHGRHGIVPLPVTVDPSGVGGGVSLHPSRFELRSETRAFVERPREHRGVARAAPADAP